MAHHRPPHLYLDNTWYIITAATVRHAPLLQHNGAKEIGRTVLKSLVADLGVTLQAWVILDDHYHLLLQVRCGKDLPRLIGRLNASPARLLNLRDTTPGRQVWYSYWDSCIRSEVDLWSRLNCIHHNPVKHGYVDQVADWSFSSYHYYLRTRGQEWLDDCWTRYPVIDFLQGDDFSAKHLRQ